MFKFVALIAALLLSGAILSAPAHAGEKGKRFNKKAERNENKKERVIMGDSIAFAIDRDDDLKLTAAQKEFLQKLKRTLDAEREKEKEEIEAKDLMQQFKTARKQGYVEQALKMKEKARELMEKQAEKWEDRTNKELEKVLPKEHMAKLKELRGDPEKFADNPFE